MWFFSSKLFLIIIFFSGDIIQYMCRSPSSNFCIQNYFIQLLLLILMLLLQAAAMFKVLRESPPIPESLSSEGKDFLRCCFRRNPAERPSAGMLLAHRFLKNSQQFDDKSFTQGFNAMKLQVDYK